MIVRTIDDIKGTDGEVSTSNWVSRRLLLANDGMGFSFHDTVIYAGTETSMQYLNHLEAVYCTEGEGEIKSVDDDRSYPIKAGTIYALDKHEKHILNAKTEMHMICIFNPPCTGREVHDANGAYPLEDPHSLSTHEKRVGQTTRQEKQS